MSIIRPSPALVVNSDTSIAESVRKMREASVGSVLVLRASVPHDLMGIFTERDLLNRVEEIQQGGHWEKSITTVMKKSLHTVFIGELNLASEIMLKYKIRHLPVVYEDEHSRMHLAGMISMRDLFKKAVEDARKTPEQRFDVATRIPEIGIICNDEESTKIISSVLKQGDKAVLHELTMRDPVESMNALVLDLDHFSATEWANYLKRLNSVSRCPPLVILFSPGLHEAKNVKILKQLDDSRKILVFAKPIDIFGILQQLELGF